MPEPDADAELMMQVKGGGAQGAAALERLMAEWQAKVSAFLFRSLPDAGEVEELTMQVFVQLWKSASRYQPSARFSTYLFTIARNLCLNEQRRRSRRPTESLDAPGPGGGEHPAAGFPDTANAAPDEAMQQAELAEKLAEALTDLPEKQRTALLLCRDSDLSYEEIALVLGASVPATKSLIHRARETVKSRLKPYVRTGEWA